MEDLYDPVIKIMCGLDVTIPKVKKIIMESDLFQHSSKSILDKLHGSVQFYDFYSEEQHHIIESYAMIIRKQLTHEANVEWEHQRFVKDIIYTRVQGPDSVQVPSDFTQRESEIMLGYFKFLLDKGIKKIERINDDNMFMIHYIDGKKIILNTREWRL